MTRETLEEMITIGVEFLTVAIFLVFVVNFVGIKKDFAEVKNNKTATAHQVRQYREFGKYETGFSPKTEAANYKSECLYADDVLEAIRNYRDGSIEIYVDKPNSTGVPIHLTTGDAEQNPSNYSLEVLTSTAKGVDLSALFHPYLIYNGSDVTDPSYYNNYSSGTVTGIAFIRY
ncbi:hypothetical protein SAMN02745136_03129 [Anaerocolumna jejuensis DSM 15929]|uniref:Uncharacterized protein n=1 Tax=Anaerocolumna jejuensis DSM 15929 TaxID=1121322 RepID=A0A1M6UK73_9FIRM|nr:hypothetical protein [Anaerocolumna jejuensis]SHK69645.1 hypothetical protein SAMN02745136_03129 [Anaerocolumna jejuensis DSM 15929]